MKDTNSLHARLQEMNDCFAEADPAGHLQSIAHRGTGGEVIQDTTEVALKYLSLALLSAVDAQAEKIVFAYNGKNRKNGSCQIGGPVETRLPPPPPGVTREIISILRHIAGLEADKAYGRMVCGIREDRLVMDVGVARAGERENLSLTILKV